MPNFLLSLPFNISPVCKGFKKNYQVFFSWGVSMSGSFNEVSIFAASSINTKGVL